MVWSRNELAKVLLRDRASNEQAAQEQVPRLPGSLYPLPKRDIGPPSNEEISASRRNSFVQQMENIADTYKYVPSFKPTSYLEDAENMMFEVGEIERKRSERLQNPKVKIKNKTYNVNVPMPVADPVPLPQGYGQTTILPGFKATGKRPSTGSSMASMTPKQMQKYEAAIVAGKSHAQAMKAAGVSMAPIPNKTIKGAKGTKTSVPSGGFGSFVRAISGQESGGNYGAVNSSSGALGKYQIMPGNIPGWSKSVLGHTITPQQFLASPKLQEQIAQGVLRRYYNSYGPAGAAAAWYAGPDDAVGWKNNTAPQGAYPSVVNYVRSVMSRMR